MEESRLALSLWGEYYSKSRQENLRSHVESGTVNSHSANALAFIQSFYKSFSTQRMISRRRNPFSCGCFSCEGDNYEEVKRSTIEKVVSTKGAKIQKLFIQSWQSRLLQVRQVLETEETGRGRMIAAFNPRLKNSQGLTGLKDPRQTAIVQSHTSLPDRRESMIFSAPKRDLNTNLYSSLHSKTPVRHNSDMPGFAIEFKQRWSHGSCSHLNSPSPLKASGQVESPGEDHDKSKGRNETNDCNRRSKTLPPQNSDSIEHGKLNPETLLKCIGNLFNENNEPQILRALQYLALGIEEYMDSFGMCL